MGETLAVKILAAHAGLPEVHAGQFVEVDVDLVLANDITAPIAITEFRKLGVERVFDPERVVIVPDHFAPNKDIRSAEQCQVVREFARAQGLSHYFEVGRMGIEHVLLPEQGLVLPGDLVIGADSHTCTYGALGAFATGMGSTDIAVAMATGRTWLRVPETVRIVYNGPLQPWVGGKDLILYTIGQIGVDGARYQVLEFAGPAVEALSMDGRFTMSNMAIEAGAKAGLFAVDDKTRVYVAAAALRGGGGVAAPAGNGVIRALQPDVDAPYARVLEIDASRIEPQVAFPHLPENSRPVCQAGEVPIDQVIIGSCTNGRQEDLRVAAAILRGRRVHERVRCIIIPGSQQVYLDGLRDGLIEVFVEAGAVVSTPTCGPCLGGHMGVLAGGERAVSTTNRNFRGRMGHRESEVFLAGPAVAAASAVAGRIVGPDSL